MQYSCADERDGRIPFPGRAALKDPSEECEGTLERNREALRIQYDKKVTNNEIQEKLKCCEKNDNQQTLEPKFSVEKSDGTCVFFYNCVNEEIPETIES